VKPSKTLFTSHTYFIIISDFEEEEQVEKNTIEIEEEVEQPIELE
jgi:hypothetical protein